MPVLETVKTITWNTNVNAPCCPGEILSDDGRSILVQLDYDFPGTARSFGWSLSEIQRCKKCGEIVNVDGVLTKFSCDGDGSDCDLDDLQDCCDHESTDGTVDCGCGCTAGDFIAAAYEWLHDNDGVTAEDPGYFG